MGGDAAVKNICTSLQKINLSKVENLILTPHIAGLTAESNVRVSQTISEQILSFLDSKGGQI